MARSPRRSWGGTPRSWRVRRVLAAEVLTRGEACRRGWRCGHGVVDGLGDGRGGAEDRRGEGERRRAMVRRGMAAAPSGVGGKVCGTFVPAALTARLQPADSARPSGYGSPESRMEFRILGPLEVRADGHAVALPGAKPRAVLAVLLLHANRAVSAERLAQALWGEDAPAGAANTVQVHVSRLRKALPDPAALVTTASGYELRIDPARRRRARASSGGSRRDARRSPPAAPSAAAAALEEALALWRGPPARRPRADEPFAQREAARLEDLRAAALEELAEARLALGRHAEVAADLERLVGRAPVPRAAAGAADARPLPLRPPGGRAAGLPRRAAGAGRRARDRAGRAAARAGAGDPRAGPGAGPGRAAPAARGRRRARRPRGGS